MLLRVLMSIKLISNLCLCMYLSPTSSFTQLLSLVRWLPDLLQPDLHLFCYPFVALFLTLQAIMASGSGFRNFDVLTNVIPKVNVGSDTVKRPAKLNKQGREITVGLNTFSVKNFPSKPIHQYDVSLPASRLLQLPALTPNVRSPSVVVQRSEA